MALLNSRVVRVSVASLATGLLIGGVGAAFRLLLIKADDLRTELVFWAHTWPYAGWLVPMAGACWVRLWLDGWSSASLPPQVAVVCSAWKPFLTGRHSPPRMASCW